MALTLLCYWPALHGSLVWDDEAHVTKPALQTIAGLGRIWTSLHATQQYYPLLHSAFWLEHRLWGDAPLGYHLANVFEHAAAALLLVVLLARLRVQGSVLAGVLFAVHPVCVESVAWISEQKNTLSLDLFLLASLAYLQFSSVRGTRAGAPAYAAATLFFVLALLTKSVTAILPAALLVIAWWQHGRLSWRRDVLPLLPWFLVAIASGLLTSWIERTVIGADGADFSLNLPERFLLASRIVWFYCGKLVWPFHLSFVYEHWDVRSSIASWSLCLAAALGATAVFWVLRRRTRGPAAAWFLFVGALFPALGFFNVYPFIFSYVADHFQYLASVAFFSAAAAGATQLIARVPQAARAVSWCVIALVVGGLAFLSHARSAVYGDAPTLYRATLAENPGCWMAHNNLGVWHEGRGEADEAVAEYRAALSLRAAFPQAHNNLGSVLLRTPGRLAEATAEFQEAVRLKPDFADAHDSLGNALAITPGRLDDAIAEYREALRIMPDFPEALNNLGNALMAVPGRNTDAVAAFRASLRLNPLSADAHNNLGNALSAQGSKEEAVAEYRETLRLMPSYDTVHFNIAMALLNVPGQRPEAARELREFLHRRPYDATARRILEQISPTASPDLSGP